MYYMGYGWWFWMLALWAALIWSIVWFISRANASSKKEKTPFEIAQIRYAKGNITKKEYRDIIKELRGS